MGRPAGHATRALRLYTGKVTRMQCVSLLITNKSIISELCHMVSACFRVWTFRGLTLEMIIKIPHLHPFLIHLETYEKMAVMH